MEWAAAHDGAASGVANMLRALVIIHSTAALLCYGGTIALIAMLVSDGAGGWRGVLTTFGAACGMLCAGKYFESRAEGFR